MQITSTAFQHIETIPLRFTADGEDISPPILWADLPLGCQSLALICEDPDAPRRPGRDYPFVHWIAFNIPPDAGMLPEGLPKEWSVDNHVKVEQGLNSFGRPGYHGPSPPEGSGMHRYYFQLFALSRWLKLPVRPMKEHLLKAMEGGILGKVSIIGTYGRALEIAA
ncbi:MAG TPA: YbhB/YbcL family Raf kinase inhibitor-like protein [Bdellovibrionota bacterium]|jgi:hypothetical protein